VILSSGHLYERVSVRSTTPLGSILLLHGPVPDDVNHSWFAIDLTTGGLVREYSLFLNMGESYRRIA